MSFFPIEELLAKVDSKYRLAIIVSKRVRQLNEELRRSPGNYTELINIALKEIAQGKIQYKVPGDNKVKSEEKVKGEE
jgi:DNA-directed RNA polymerase omega subunit